MELTKSLLLWFNANYLAGRNKLFENKIGQLYPVITLKIKTNNDAYSQKL